MTIGQQAHDAAAVRVRDGVLAELRRRTRRARVRYCGQAFANMRAAAEWATGYRVDLALWLAAHPERPARETTGKPVMPAAAWTVCLRRAFERAGL